jgi:hypothetical protein
MNNQRLGSRDVMHVSFFERVLHTGAMAISLMASMGLLIVTSSWLAK